MVGSNYIMKSCTHKDFITLGRKSVVQSVDIEDWVELNNLFIYLTKYFNRQFIVTTII